MEHVLFICPERWPGRLGLILVTSPRVPRFAQPLRQKLHVRFPHGSFGRNVLTMMSGTFVAQALPIAVSPILTRIFTPAEFGLFAVYSSMALILTTFSTGRYEIAILLPEKDEDAANISALALLLLTGVCLITLLVNGVFNTTIARLLGNRAVGPWLYMMPLTVFVAALYEVLYYWTNRKAQFRRLAITKVIISSSTAAANVAMGAAKVGAGGLIVGGLAGQGAATAVLAGQLWKEDRPKLRWISAASMAKMARRYIKFPKFSLPADSINVGSNQIPAVLLSNFFGEATSGFFLLTQRVLGVPMSLVARSFLDVFKQQASRDFIDSGNCRRIYMKTFKSLCMIAGIPLAIFFLFGPPLFVIVFGPEWREAGLFARLLSAMFFFRFVASPLSYVLYLAEKQNYDLVWQIGLFSLTVASFGGGALLHNPRLGVVFYSASYSLMYIVYLFMSYHFSGGHSGLLLRSRLFKKGFRS